MKRGEAINFRKWFGPAPFLYLNASPWHRRGWPQSEPGGGARGTDAPEAHRAQAHTPRGPGPLGMSDCFCASPLGRGRVCLRGLSCSAAERHCTWLHAKPSGSGSPRSVSVLLGPVPFPISELHQKNEACNELHELPLIKWPLRDRWRGRCRFRWLWLLRNDSVQPEWIYKWQVRVTMFLEIKDAK